MHCSTANFTSPASTTATSRISVLRTLWPRQRAPRLQAMTSLSAVIPNKSAPSAVATGTPDVFVRRGIGCADSDSLVKRVRFRSDVLCLHSGKLLSNSQCFPKGSLLLLSPGRFLLCHKGSRPLRPQVDVLLLNRSIHCFPDLLAA